MSPPFLPGPALTAYSLFQRTIVPTTLFPFLFPNLTDCFLNFLCLKTRIDFSRKGISYVPFTVYNLLDLDILKINYIQHLSRLLTFSLWFNSLLIIFHAVSGSRTPRTKLPAITNWVYSYQGCDHFPLHGQHLYIHREITSMSICLLFLKRESYSYSL